MSIDFLFEPIKTNAEIEKESFLINNGFIECLPGYWMPKCDYDNGLNPYDNCLTFNDAYLKLKNEITKKPVINYNSEEYLHKLEKTLNSNIELFTHDEFKEIILNNIYSNTKHKFVYDIECYPNYFFIAFKSLENNKYLFFDCNDNGIIGKSYLLQLISNCEIIGFNNKIYDDILLQLALSGKLTVHDLFVESSNIITNDIKGWKILNDNNVKFNIDSIDLIEIAPLKASLKTYGGRLNSKHLQDLPFSPTMMLTDRQKNIVKYYCFNDLDLTYDLYYSLENQINLRRNMSIKYKTNLKSKSDAQIAETVLKNELGREVSPHTYPIGTILKYNAPDYLEFENENLNTLFELIKSEEFELDEYGKIILPKSLSEFDININNLGYTVGIGGLHSKEKSVSYSTDNNMIIVDRDVTSYYPMIILNQRLFPESIGEKFLDIYEGFVNTRIKAKKEKDKVTADSLKITINGLFGKFGSKYSIVYSPQLLLQVTITGQLSLLMLIDMMAKYGIKAVSANTDGVVFYTHKDNYDLLNNIILEWEKLTNFNTEETRYKKLCLKDVNNYIGILDKEYIENDDANNYVKLKGIFANISLSKNPKNLVCITAIKNKLVKNIDIEDTIKNCTDICEFTTVRTVNGGAALIEYDKEPEYMGKTVRFYYGKDSHKSISYISNGNKVPDSFGIVPCMTIPTAFPDNIDYNKYISETKIIANWANINL